MQVTSLDGTKLHGTSWTPDHSSGLKGIAVAIHGINSEHTESGLYTDLGERLAKLSIETTSIDLRGHGASEGRQEDFCLSGALMDICSTIDQCRREGLPLFLIGASFSGGLSLYISRYLRKVESLILLNPRVNYRPWLEDSPLLTKGLVNKEQQRILRNTGYIERKGFHLSSVMLNEIASFTLESTLHNETPTLVLHGEDDTTIPWREPASFFEDTPMCEIEIIPNAQHGFVATGADLNSKATQAMRSKIVERIADFVEAGCSDDQ